MQTLEGQFDCCTETLFDVSLKLEVKEKAYTNAEGDVGALSRRILLLEDEEEISEDRLAATVTKLCKESKRADAAIKGRQMLENAQTVSIEHTDKLEAQLRGRIESGWAKSTNFGSIRRKSYSKRRKISK